MILYLIKEPYESWEQPFRSTYTEVSFISTFSVFRKFKTFTHVSYFKVLYRNQGNDLSLKTSSNYRGTPLKTLQYSLCIPLYIPLIYPYIDFTVTDPSVISNRLRNHNGGEDIDPDFTRVPVHSSSDLVVSTSSSSVSPLIKPHLVTLINPHPLVEGNGSNPRVLPGDSWSPVST